MTNLTKGIAVAALALALPLSVASNADAAPLMAGSALSTAAIGTASTDVTQVRWRGGHGWHGGPGWRGGYYRHGGYGWGGVGAGLAAGALIGGAIAASQAPYAYGPGYYAPGPSYYASAPAYGGDDAISYCMQRFKSYDPNSGTYLGYDGRRHPCP